MAITNPTLIPFSITAKSRNGLSIAMLKNNQATNTQYKYFDIQYVNGEWVAWFYANAIDRKGELNGKT